MVFFGTDPDRMTKRKVVVELMVYPGDDMSNYLVFEWGINYSFNQTNTSIDEQEGSVKRIARFVFMFLSSDQK